MNSCLSVGYVSSTSASSNIPGFLSSEATACVGLGEVVDDVVIVFACCGLSTG